MIKGFSMACLTAIAAAQSSIVHDLVNEGYHNAAQVKGLTPGYAFYTKSDLVTSTQSNCFYYSYTSSMLFVSGTNQNSLGVIDPNLCGTLSNAIYQGKAIMFFPCPTCATSAT